MSHTPLVAAVSHPRRSRSRPRSFRAGAVSAGPAQFVIVNLNAAGRRIQRSRRRRRPSAAIPERRSDEQRLIAFEHAASIWSARLDSTVPIRIRAQFTALAAGVLGSAGPVPCVRDFPNAPLPGTWYHVALANKLAGVDLISGQRRHQRQLQHELQLLPGSRQQPRTAERSRDRSAARVRARSRLQPAREPDHRRAVQRLPRPLQQQTVRHVTACSGRR